MVRGKGKDTYSSGTGGYWCGSAGGYVGSSAVKSVGNGSQGLGGIAPKSWESSGGAGLYGGGASNGDIGVHGDSGGDGGSSYIGNALLTNKLMYCYNCTESSAVTTKTISTTCHSSTPTENCAKEGNGYARITLIS